MACFLVPAAEAVITTVATKIIEKNEKKIVNENSEIDIQENNIEFSKKLKWLNTLLWGGSALLAFEHLWHGEIIPFFPFLTAASNYADTVKMLNEMATVGVGMALAVTAVWTVMLVVSNSFKKRAVDIKSPLNHQEAKIK